MSPSNNIGGRFLKGRRNAAKEQIEAWMNSGDSGIAPASRVSGQLPKNVTEAKMLNTALLEMSKQRYNFIKHSQWTQKRFLDRQRQKTAVMKDLLKNVDMDKISTKHMSVIELPNLENNKFENSSEPARSSHTAPGISRPISPKSSSTRESKLYAFVTERKSIRSSVYSMNLKEDEDEEEIKENKNLRKRRDSKWPVKDERFVKLYKNLCDVYPSRFPIIKNKQTISLVT